MFENTFNTFMDVKGRQKTTLRLEWINFYCHCKIIELVCDESHVAKPKVSFVLDNNTHLLVYQWVKSLYFPEEYVLNLSRLVNLEDCGLYEMKSYDCHMFIQTPILLAYQDLSPNGIWNALMKISHFFRDICCNKL